MEKFVGRIVRFEAQPYHRGLMEITAVEPGKGMWKDYFVVHGKGTRVIERSRLGGHSLEKVMPEGRGFTLYHFSEKCLEAAINGEKALIHVYPV